jgi:response regulator RpfG family c-di-GMP phosphodiesterase
MEDSLIVKIINEGVGTQFDPDVVAAFNQAYKAGRITDYLKTGEIK